MNNQRHFLSSVVVILIWAVALYFGNPNPEYTRSIVVLGSAIPVLQLGAILVKNKWSALFYLLLGPARLAFVCYCALALFDSLNLLGLMVILGLATLTHWLVFIGAEKVNHNLFWYGFVLEALSGAVVSSLGLISLIYFQTIFAIVWCFAAVFILAFLGSWIDTKFSYFMTRVTLKIPAAINRKDVTSCYIYRQGKMIKVLNLPDQSKGGYLSFVEQSRGGHYHLTAYGNNPSLLGDAGIRAMFDKKSKSMVLGITQDAYKKLSIQSLKDCKICECQKEMGYDTDEQPG